jgi:chemotaxis protein MotB
VEGYSIFKNIAQGRRKARKSNGEVVWLTSYADLTTNLMALFVLMLSISQISAQKFEVVAQAVSKPRLDTLAELKKVIDNQIVLIGLENQVSTELGHSGLSVEFTSGLLFEQGKETLTNESLEEALPILKIIQATDRKYMLSFEGHTDDVGSDAGNWVLSSARGVALLNNMRELGVPADRMSVAGFGSTRPKVQVQGKDGSELEAARAANRRVVIRVYQ